MPPTPVAWDPASQDRPVEGVSAYPFWGFQDFTLLLGAVVPSLLTAYLLVSVARRLSPTPWSDAAQTMALQALAYLFWFLALYTIFHIRYSQPFWDSLAWSGSGRSVLAALAGGVVLAVAIVIAGGLLQLPKVDNPIQRLLSGPASIVLVGLFATTLGPLCEELFFRGFLMPLLCRMLGPAVGIILAAVPFALLHGPGYGWSWRHMALVGLAGVAFGWTRFRAGSTAAATAMHVAYNLTLFLGYLFLEGDSLP